MAATTRSAIAGSKTGVYDLTGSGLMPATFCVRRCGDSGNVNVGMVQQIINMPVQSLVRAQMAGNAGV